MSFYHLIRRLLFVLPPELSHDLSLDLLGASERLRLLSLIGKTRVYDPVSVMGIEFPNAVGLAAGLDKNGDYFNALGELGFGFVEIGTVTPRSQPGNPKPRMFRLPDAQAIINRLGFNNKGVDHLVSNVKRRRYSGVLGINIGKNFDTPVESAAADYLVCMEKVYLHADYITINISSPNTPGLRDLQFGVQLSDLLERLKAKQKDLERIHEKYVPLAIKIAPDLEQEDIEELAEVFNKIYIDGVIVSNTTISRDAVAGLAHSDEAGGLSGSPVTDKSTDVIRYLRQRLDSDIPIVGVGGILTAQDAVEKIAAGASLVQIYTGFIYEGPSLVYQSARAISASRTSV